MIRRTLILLLSLAALLLSFFAVRLVLRPEAEAERRQNTEEVLAEGYLAEALKEGVTQEEEMSGKVSSTQTKADSKVDSEGAEEKAPEDTKVFLSKVDSVEVEGVISENFSVGTSETISENISAGISETISEELSVRASSAPFTDDVYYSRGATIYTPDYAEGELLGVLEIEPCEIRRGVYGGSWEAIYHDLDIWMVTAARPDYRLGETHFVVYGHNHPTQNLSFNRLKELQIGEVFTFTSAGTVFIYEVTGFFADWRDVVTETIVDNFSLPSECLYIVTCGRGEYACKDIVFEGTLKGTVAASVYAEDPDYYRCDPAAFTSEKQEDLCEESVGSAPEGMGAAGDKTADFTSDTLGDSRYGSVGSAPEGMGAAGGKTADFTSDTLGDSHNKSTDSAAKTLEDAAEISADEGPAASSRLSATLTFSIDSEGELLFSCTDENGAQVPCEIGVYDMDGLPVARVDYPETSSVELELQEGEKYIGGVVNYDRTRYEPPADVVFQYHAGELRKAEITETVTDENGLPTYVKPVVFILLAAGIGGAGWMKRRKGVFW